MKPINIVLYCPEIPQNTGNISRTCAVTGAALHIIKPMGFEISDRTLKRAGLDYWDKLSVTYYESADAFFEKNKDAEIYYFSSKGHKNYCDVDYPRSVFLMFGPETKGLPEELLKENLERCVRIPMLPTLRCLNLSNAVAVAVYEVLRQTDFADMETFGSL
ncbi:MAG: tRNA (uridine(34)/cytosine(34)/5-carboxymethylaminomethyluridine(34)-2'-O)-methyltransferase TrmL [Clostridia bacterium]|nr:tRNA (uridine(34)/cytosine(34)/5-carboxymethylaminomethyluridine(34)-2'-O)-methyltransferase TrmL [Clostridia bacterium]MBQ8268962.1 tRNA (uridine(34)/cytosine(34)/5-carboxymethylaminomethyluridine(34)-2'-O)-methyltransferase TrmL [Clostridia bacterium]